jgi:hypothetical protein
MTTVVARGILRSPKVGLTAHSRTAVRGHLFSALSSVHRTRVYYGAQARAVMTETKDDSTSKLSALSLDEKGDSKGETKQEGSKAVSQTHFFCLTLRALPAAAVQWM